MESWYRAQLVEAYAERVVDGMDMDEVLELAFEAITTRLATYTDEDLLEEVTDFYPDLVEEIEEPTDA
jgi:hypothetical protein